MRTRRPGRPGDDSRARRQPPSERRPGEGRGRPPERAPRNELRLPRGSEALYGRNAVAEALAGRRRLMRLFLAEGVRDDARMRAVVQRAKERTVPVDRVPRLQLDDLTGGANHQGLVLEAGPYPYAELESIVEREGAILVFDHLQDPQNFGTLLRAAEVAGVAGVVIARDRAVAVTPAVVNASAGAVEHLLVAQETNLARTLDRLIAQGWWAIGLDTGPDAVDLFITDLPTPVALVVGGEGAGLTPNVRKRCQVIVSLPTRGRVASLNAATAGSVALFELLRRGLGSPPTGP